MADKLKSEIKVGVILSYILIVINSVLSIIMTPLLISNLGQSEYGIYMLVGTLAGYITVFDFGLHNTVNRFIAKFQLDSNENKQANFLAHIFLLYIIVVFVVIIFSFILLLNFNSIFTNSLTIEEIDLARQMLLILSLSVAINLPLGTFQYIILGYGKFIFNNNVQIFRAIFRTGLILIALFMSEKSLAIVLIDALINVFISVIYMIYARRKLKIRVRLYNFEYKLIREISGYSFYIFMIAIVNQIFWKMGQFMSGVLISSSAVAIFSVAMNFIFYFQQGALGISSSFLPKIAQTLDSDSSNSSFFELMKKIGRIQLFILGLVIVGFVVIGQDFIYLWVGSEFKESYLLTLLIMIPLLFPMTMTIAELAMQVLNTHKTLAINYLLMSFVNIVLTLILGKWLGLIGIALSTFISIVIFQITIPNLYYRKKLRINITKYYIEIF